jgi:hypothetical protein
LVRGIGDLARDRMAVAAMVSGGVRGLGGQLTSQAVPEATTTNLPTVTRDEEFFEQHEIDERPPYSY